jgi:hypothetical protein
MNACTSLIMDSRTLPKVREDCEWFDRYHKRAGELELNTSECLRDPKTKNLYLGQANVGAVPRKFGVCKQI